MCMNNQWTTSPWKKDGPRYYAKPSTMQDTFRQILGLIGGDWEMGTAVSCTKCSQMAGPIHATGRCTRVLITFWFISSCWDALSSSFCKDVAFLASTEWATFRGRESGPFFHNMSWLWELLIIFRNQKTTSLYIQCSHTPHTHPPTSQHYQFEHNDRLFTKHHWHIQQWKHASLPSLAERSCCVQCHG